MFKWSQLLYNIIRITCLNQDPNEVWLYLPDKSLHVYFNLKHTTPRLPCWLSGEEPACKCRRHGFNPWSGEIPHASGQLSLCITTAEPTSLEPTLPNERSHCSEKPQRRHKEEPCSRQLQPALEQQWRPSAAKNKWVNETKHKPKDPRFPSAILFRDKGTPITWKHSISLFQHWECFYGGWDWGYTF